MDEEVSYYLHFVSVSFEKRIPSPLFFCHLFWKTDSYLYSSDLHPDQARFWSHRPSQYGGMVAEGGGALPWGKEALQSNWMFISGQLLQTSATTLVFWFTTCSEQFATAANNLLASVAKLRYLKAVSLVFLANSFLNWNFDLEYYPAGEIRVLSCEWQREANLFKATTTNFTCDIKQNRKFKPQHVYKSNFISTADLN